MIATATTSLYRLARGEIDADSVMAWTCPVPFFGSLRNSSLATVGINPSSREFVDVAGHELDGRTRRFPTLRSLGLRDWADASSLDVSTIVAACDDYFTGNPYQRWFNTLDAVLRPVGASYYSVDSPATHLDLVPYATDVKWGALPLHQRRSLLHAGRDLLASLLRESAIDLLVLNGASVVREFEVAAGIALIRQRHQAWDLPRQGAARVPGFGYTGTIDRIGDVELGRSIAVVGFNHNLQSSFGVTRRAMEGIAHWIGEQR